MRRLKLPRFYFFPQFIPPPSMSELLAQVESKVATLEKGAAFSDSAAAVNKVKLELLLELRKIKTALASSSSSSPSPCNADEVEALKVEVLELKKNLSKRDYRIEILLKTLDSEQEVNI